MPLAALAGRWEVSMSINWGATVLIWAIALLILCLLIWGGTRLLRRRR
jgi:hypothetical protein